MPYSKASCAGLSYLLPYLSIPQSYNSCVILHTTGHRDAWSSLYRLIRGSTEPPWHVYPDQVQAEAYCQAFPRGSRATALSAAAAVAGLKPSDGKDNNNDD